MTSSQLIRLGVTGLAVALSACGLGATSPEVPPDVHAFVASEPVLSPQRVENLHEDRAAGIVIFRLQNGPPQDCPSGCFFDRALGIRAEGRVGWWDRPFGEGPWSIFDVRATDASLFDPTALSRIKAELDSWTFWHLANFLACDPDMPSAAREHLAAEVGDGTFPRCPPALRAAFEAAGFTDVKPVLSSGNVVSTATRAAESSLERKAEAAMLKGVGHHFLTIVRPIDALSASYSSRIPTRRSACRRARSASSPSCATSEKTFGEEVTTRTWKTVAKIAR